MSQHHYTNRTGYNGIRAGVVWHFHAALPPGNRPFGAYFTTLPPGTKRLASCLRIPRSKLAFVFVFDDAGDLTPLSGGRGEFIFYSPTDYDVDKPRQLYAGVA
jgi:hypothetical protein